jgi:hypothetical protein
MPSTSRWPRPTRSSAATARMYADLEAWDAGATGAISGLCPCMCFANITLVGTFRRCGRWLTADAVNAKPQVHSHRTDQAASDQ